MEVAKTLKPLIDSIIQKLKQFEAKPLNVNSTDELNNYWCDEMDRIQHVCNLVIKVRGLEAELNDVLTRE